MKKVILCVMAALVLCSCTSEGKQPSKTGQSGVWISYYELNTMLESEDGFKTEFSKVLENCKSLEIKDLYIHTRAFGETLYLSDYFPLTKAARKYDYDVFGYIVGECKKAGLKVYAWINPYRISSSSDVEKLNTQSPAYKWLNDSDTENDTNIAFANGIYFNPASGQVRGLVLDGVREVIAKYEVDGIHFDDYFYPTQSADFDAADYAEYKKTAEAPLSLAEWRRENVNLLISSCYSVIKYCNKDAVFSISPAASNEHNYENLYADIKLWIKNGWLDEIIPQLYFGFEYPDKDFCFENLAEEWKALAMLNPDVTLKIGLASYKAEPALEADRKEWESNFDIIARQVMFCDNDTAISGYVYFSYSSLFGDKAAFKAQKENILEYLKTGDKK